MMDGYGMSGGFGFGGGFMIFWWIIIAIAIIAVIKWVAGSGSTAARGQEKTALQILDERYARGEIDEEEYQRRKSELIR